MRMRLGLTPEQHAERRKGLGGSDANTLMNGDPAAIQALWEEKTGKRDPEDLSRVLPVMLGSWTEEFNRYWFELTTDRKVTGEQQSAQHADVPFMRASLDGLTTTERAHAAIFEAKHVNAFSKIDEVVQRYMPQLHHNMACAGVRWAVLSVFLGTQGYETYEVERDDWYLAQLIDRERAFWECVTSDTPPPGMEAIKPPAAPVKLRTVDMAGNNLWASRAAEWVKYRDPAKAFEVATKDLKGAMEPDMGRAYGHGIEIKRAKNGNLSIREMANAAE